MPDNPERARPIRNLLECLAWALLALLFCYMTTTDIGAHRAATRGIESGLTSTAAPKNRRYGVNVALDQYASHDDLHRAVNAAARMGFGTLRQRFPWSEIEVVPGEYHWNTWDRLLDAAAQHDMEVIAVLDTSPAWARPAWECDNVWAPPTDPGNYASFVRAFSERYHDRVVAYQIWDQPNISPHWGAGPIDPAGYVMLLSKASAAIRQADPNGTIIAGGLAPNTETGGRNMSDVQFLHEIYRRGAGTYFDVLGVMAYGFWSGPEDRRVEKGVLNYSRAILLREEMIRRGQAEKPVWATDAGWCALEDWAGEAPPQGSDSAFIQGERIAGALQRMREEWPWMERVCLMQLQPAAPATDPIWGYALLDAHSDSTDISKTVRRAIRDQHILYPGAHRDWRGLATQGSRPEAIDIAFWGNQLAVEAEWGSMDGSLHVTIDEHHRKRVDLGLESGPGTWRSVGRFPVPREHHARITGAPEQLDAIVSVRVGHHPDITRLVFETLIGFLAVLGCAVRAWQVGRHVAWRRAYAAILDSWENVPTLIRWGILLLFWAMGAVAPWPMARIGSILVYAAFALLSPQYGLSIAILCVPLAPLHVPLGPGTFSLLETAVLIAIAARLGHTLLTTRPAHAQGGIDALIRSTALTRSVDWLDFIVFVLVFLGLGTSFLAEYRRVALREWRVMVCESAILYGLVRLWARDRCALTNTMDLVLMGGLGVALFALVVYPTPMGVIKAEGVRRARAFYGSPNNLALYLERILPLAVAVGLYGRTAWRRKLYRWGAVPIALALLLTFSRGALFFGLPAAALVLAALGGRRMRRWILIGLVICIAVMIPFMGTQRIASLFDFQQGTSFLRVNLWRASLDIAVDHPWLGIGLDNFLYYYGDYVRAGAEVDRWLSHPHNIVLDFWLRLGLAGVGLITGLLALFWQRANRILADQDSTDLRAMTIGAVAGVAAMLGHGLIDSSFFVIELAAWFMFVLAWVNANWIQSERTK